MIRRAALLMTTLACITLVLAGPISFLHGFPDDALWIEDNVQHAHPDAALIRGTIHVVWSRPISNGPAQDREIRGAGFYCRTRVIGNTVAGGAGVPFWAPALLCSVWPALIFRKRVLLRRKRRNQNLCVNCGYPLTGLVEPRCPECGTSLPQNPPSEPSVVPTDKNSGTSALSARQ